MAVKAQTYTLVSENPVNAWVISHIHQLQGNTRTREDHDREPGEKHFIDPK